ncbi:MAG: hypothetical protein WDZ37_07195 [Solirubrobacterales bacterium]
MTREQAAAECTRLSREDPERERFEFMPREAEGEWSVVKVPLPEGIRRTRHTGTAIEPPPESPAGPDSDERARNYWPAGGA